MGAPQSALAGTALTPELDLVFDTLKSTRKYRNLPAHPQSSFVLGWDNGQTVQMGGEAGEPAGDALRKYRESTVSHGRTAGVG